MTLLAPHFQVLPIRSGGAAENMATDFMLLQRYPETDYLRFRHYGWHRSAFTFGYSQKIAAMRGLLPPGEPVDLCRRPTGGGLVDHRDDWTYALVIPRGHVAYDARAIESYRLIHTALAESLQALGQTASLKERGEPPRDEPEPVAGACFARAELFDVICPQSGRKLAGAAQKRNKQGLLFQGSLARSAVAESLDWDQLHVEFTQKLASSLGSSPVESGWPDWSDDELSQLTEQYSSPEWNEFR